MGEDDGDMISTTYHADLPKRQVIIHKESSMVETREIVIILELCAKMSVELKIDKTTTRGFQLNPILPLCTTCISKKPILHVLYR